MSRHWIVVLIMALAVTAFAGCGGDDDSDDTESSDPTATTAAPGTASSSGVSTEGTFTAAELEQWGQDLVSAIATGDQAALTDLLTGIVPQERIDEIAACKPDDLTMDNVFVTVVVDPPAMSMEGTVDVTQGGDTETKVVLWNTELSEVSDGVYSLSSPPSGCPFVFQ
jgi:hypothetical protein